MYYAYLRISKKKRSRNDDVDLSVQEQTERQEMLIKDYCFNNDILGSDVAFFIDIISGKIKNDQRENYSTMKANLKKGDTVIVSEVSRLGRDLIDTKEEYYWYLKNGVNLIVLELNMLNIVHNNVEDSVDMMYLKEQLISMYTYMAQKTRENIGVNTSQALQAKKRRGAKLGRKPTYNHQEIIGCYLSNKDITYRDLSEEFGLTLGAISNIMKRNNVNPRTRKIEEQ